MKLNIDCIIDVLINAEQRTGYEECWTVSPRSVGGMEIYTISEAMYHIRLCADEGLIKIGSEFIDGSMEIVDLTPAGHLALHAVRHPEVRNKAKSEWLSKVQEGLISSSISGFFSLAAEILKTACLQ